MAEIKKENEVIEKTSESSEKPVEKSEEKSIEKPILSTNTEKKSNTALVVIIVILVMVILSGVGVFVLLGTYGIGGYFLYKNTAEYPAIEVTEE